MAIRVRMEASLRAPPYLFSKGQQLECALRSCYTSHFTENHLGPGRSLKSMSK
jgi:hypothetical protein